MKGTNGQANIDFGILNGRVDASGNVLPPFGFAPQNGASADPN